MPVNHYENFPVASILLPARLRSAVEAIYLFARSADDLADEGDASPEVRLNALAAYEEELNKIERNDTTGSEQFQTLAAIINAYGLPLQAFRDLLSAFKQDVTTTRYATNDLLMDYCRRSANPIGRLMLTLYDANQPNNLRDADAICSALQLINFWQDVAVDILKKRIYLPQEDLIHFGVAEFQLETGHTDGAWRTLMRFKVDRARALLLSGASLALRLPGRIGWELRLVIQGGLRILERIEYVSYDVFTQRPQLTLVDWIVILWRATKMRPH